MQSNFRELALPMVSVDPSTGKYTFEEEAMNFIRSVPGPIGVVSVAGLYRTGKSYLLNRMLLNRSSGFGVGPTVNPCTKGLWVWGTPIKGKTVNDEDVNIIVIDTQGIGALDEDETHDTKIFTLAILASSLFIYNSVGTIDQTAIQNLSLVVNLTKHIHLKAQIKSEDDIDPDEFANFFPSFFWVVRDFALKLQSSNGQTLSPKEYLERALSLQKGVSDDIEEKNRIRRLLTTFFKQRECFTLVRPHVDDNKLCALDKLGFEELRPEFMDQVLAFRKRALNKMRPKMLNGKLLNGEMYLSLMKSYVKAINDGAVPNIQNAWNYMCKEQCGKVLDESYGLFETKLKEMLGNKIPCPEQDFRSAVKYAKEQAYQLFRKKAFGDNINQYLTELKKRIKSKTNSLKTNNQKESMNVAQNYIMRGFASSIEKKLKLQQFKSYSEFEKEMQGLYAQALESGPKLPNHKLVYLQFMRKLMPQGAQFFFQASANELQKLKTLTTERQKNSEKQLKQLKDELNSTKTNTHNIISNLDREKVQLTLRVERLSEELDKITKDRQSQSTKLGKSLEARQLELESLKKTLQQKILQLTEKNDDINVRLVTGEKEWEKQKAVFELKVKQLSIQCEQLQKKQKLFDSSLITMKNESSYQMKENTLKYEKLVSQLKLELNEYKEKSNELGEQLKTIKESLESATEKFEKKEKKYKDDLNSKTKQLERMKHETQLDRNRLENDFELAKEQVMKDQRELSDNYKKQESMIKTLNEQLKSQKANYEKENAIISQKLEFAQENLRETKHQLTQCKTKYEAEIAAMEEANGRQREESENERIAQIKNNYMIELKNTEAQWQSSRKQLQFEIETLAKKRDELELSVSMLKNTSDKDKHDYESSLRQKDEKIESLNSELSSLERSKTARLKEQEVEFENKIKQLERELDQQKEKAEGEKRDRNARSEESIIELKNYYEMEKEQLETKINSQKEKADRKYKKMVEEYERKHKEEIANLEDQMNELHQRHADLENRYATDVNRLTHEKEMREKQVQNLEKILADLKTTTSNREAEQNKKYEEFSILARNEKNALQDKVQMLQSENNKKEKSIMNLTHLKDQLANSLEKRESTIQDQKRQIAQLNSIYEKTSEDLKKRLHDLSNEYLEKKIEYEKQAALREQEIEFNSRKVKELEQQMQNSVKQAEERFKSFKEDKQNEHRAQIEKIKVDRQILEQKYEKIKKSSREMENNLNKQISDIEKQRLLEQANYANLEAKYKENEARKATELEALTIQMNSIRQTLSSERKTLQSEIERLKIEYAKIENEKSDVCSNYERDRILWENKNIHLEKQKENIKNQSTEKIRKLENDLNELLRTKLTEKSSTDLQHNEIVSRIEKRYLTQISELNQISTKKSMADQATIKELELQLKNLNEKYILENQSKQSTRANLERRLNDLIEVDKKNQAQLDRLRQDKEQRALQYQKMLDQEKDLMKSKIRDSEQKMKVVEGEKMRRVFEYEKEKARWKLEQQQKNDKIEQLQEQTTKLTSELDRIMNENSKYKAERKMGGVQRNTSYLGSRWPDQSRMNKSNLGPSTYEPHTPVRLEDEQKENTILGQRMNSSYRNNSQLGS